LTLEFSRTRVVQLHAALFLSRVSLSNVKKRINVLGGQYTPALSYIIPW